MAFPGASAFKSCCIRDIETGHDIQNNPAVEGAGQRQGQETGHRDGIYGQEEPEKGDFESSANALWTLFGEQAKNHDEATIKTLKKDMDGLLIFAGLFSTALTALIVESKKDLKVDPQDQMAYYLQQNVAILYNISRQISSIAPQFAIPSDPPPAYPDFKPLAFNIRVNAFWFMALVFSLSAALLATLVQQWVRNYMRVFQQYSGPLKSARLRQYLYEGWKGWYMPVVAEVVTGLLHVSLLLFFVGLFDFVLNIDTAVKLSTTIPIAITSFLYICMTVARIFKPQLPYQNPFTGLIWYIIQKFGGRRYTDRDSNGAVSPNMGERQMQLAMEETDDRKGRDARSIRWLVSNMTEDAEMESLVMAIPGSFDGKWGTEMWKVPDATKDAVRELSAHVRQLLDTCKIRDLFATDQLRLKRTRACIETTASLVCCAGAEIGQFQFGDKLQLLGDIGQNPTVRESSLAGKDQSFVIRWTCLSLIAIRRILESNQKLREDTKLALERLEGMDNSDKELARDNIGEGPAPKDTGKGPAQNNTGEGQALTRTEKIIKTLNKASGCLKVLSDAVVSRGDPTEEQVRDIFKEQKNDSQISELEKIDNDNEKGGFDLDDWSINSVQDVIDQITHQVITRQLPGVRSDLYDTESLDFSPFVELYHNPQPLLFILPRQNLRRIRSFAQTLRGIRKENKDVDDDTFPFKKAIKNLREFRSLPNWSGAVHRQVWRLQDLHDGGGLGFTVELFFLALKQLLSDSSSERSHSAFYIGTFRSITSDWRKYKHNSPGTQELLLDLVVSNHNSISVVKYPADIVEVFLNFLDRMLEGETIPRLEDVETQLRNRMDIYLGLDNDPRQEQCIKAWKVIRKARGFSA